MVNIKVNMSRPRRLYKIPTTTISINENLFNEMSKFKDHNLTWDRYINRLFYSRNSSDELKEENKFMYETIEQMKNKIKEYIETIETLKKEKLELEERINIKTEVINQ